MSKLKLSKGPVPPARLPTREEQARGPQMSDVANDFRHYLNPEEVPEYKRTGKLPRRNKCDGIMVKHVYVFEDEGNMLIQQDDPEDLI